ncbi:MAG: hypothetical protein K2Q22_11120, partial [Cytophagales bacterium]|nr:hypothetical protein [Cytophagales bacterium]
MALKAFNYTKWEKEALEVFSMALEILLIENNLPNDEVEINRELAKKLTICKRKWERANDRELRGEPIYNGRQQPREQDKLKQSFESKEPEFIWQLTDSLNDKMWRYTVECKRLTDNENHFGPYYVKSGVQRFIHPDWSYGLDCPSGLMIGYIQHHEYAFWIKAINKRLTSNSLPELIE